MANYISDDKCDIINELLLEGYSIRETARLAGTSHGTVEKIRKILKSLYEEDNAEFPFNDRGGYWKHRKNKIKALNITIADSFEVKMETLDKIFNKADKVEIEITVSQLGILEYCASLGIKTFNELKKSTE